MAKNGQDEHAEGLRYGAISTRTQATQTLPVTLPVQTQPPTQLMSHELHGYTQLVHHEPAEHVCGDTLVNDGDVGGSADTVVLNDDDGELQGVIYSDQKKKELMIKSVEEGHNSTLYMHRDLPDSDATTEEGDAGSAGYLDADAESRPLHIDAGPDDEGAKAGDNTPAYFRSGLPEVEGGTENVSVDDTPQVALVAATNGPENSQSKTRSISSVRAASLRASGIRAAGRSVSLISAGKDGVKFDSESTVDLIPGSLDDESRKPQGVFETGSHGIQDGHRTTEIKVPMQSSPKVIMPLDGAPVCISTSRSKSKSVSPTPASHEHASGFTDNALSEQGIKNFHDYDATLIAEKPSFSSQCPESKLAPLESPFVSGVHQTGQPSSQKARKLVFDYVETYPTGKFGEGEGNTVSKPLNADHSNALSKQTSEIHAPAGQDSVPSRVRAGSANLTYLESHDPGEETQMNALNVVDKLVWLDASCMPDDVATSHVPQDSAVKCNTGIKGLQSLAQAAQMKAVHDKLDVFDWEDSQLDEKLSPDKKPVPVNVRAWKRQAEPGKPTMSSKKRAISHQQKAQATPSPSGKVGLNSTPDAHKPEVSNEEPLCLQDVEMKPHTLLTTRLRNRPKAESRLSHKGRQSPGWQRGSRKQNVKEKLRNELSNELGTDQQRAENNRKGKVQQAPIESSRGAGRTKSIDGSGRDLKSNQPKERSSKEGKQDTVKESKIDTNPQSGPGLPDDRTSQDDAAADVWIEAFSTAKNKTHVDNNVDLITFKKRGALNDKTGQDFKKSRTVEPLTVTKDDKCLNMLEQEKVSAEEDRVRSGPKSQKKSKTIKAATSAQHVSRRVNTRLGKVEQQNLDTHTLGKGFFDKEATVRENVKKKTKIYDSRRSKGSSLRELQDAPEREGIVPEEDEAGKELKTEQDAKQNETADLVGKRKKASPCSSVVPHMFEGLKTRSHAQVKKNKSSHTQGAATKKIGTPFSEEALQANLAMHKASMKPGKLREKESSQNLTTIVPAGVSIRRKEAADVSVPESVMARDEALGQGLKRSKRGREAADASVTDSTKVREGALSQPGKQNTNKILQNAEELKRQEGEVLGSLRRTKRNTIEGGFERHHSVNTGQESQARSEEPMPKDQSVKSTTNKPLPRQNKKTKAFRGLEKLKSSSVVDKGRRRKRESGEIHVLFSHSLTEDTIKQQKKILAKLGGHVASSALECTHFISNGFVRSQNMLISMAAGKIVATTSWLESCGLAHYFVDEKNHILHDEKKERELGFSMISSLATARRRPVFKDVKVVICGNTVPEPTALKAIVESAGGQVMNARTCLSQSDIDGNKPLTVITNEKGLDSCSQFLAKGLKVYSEELVLHGVVTQTLDLSRNRLFEDTRQQRGSRRASTATS